MTKINVVVLAAGQGKRMNSAKPKVLHEVGLVPMLVRVLDSAKSLSPDKIIVVYGHGGDILRQTFNNSETQDYFADRVIPDLEWVLQDKQLGTGHALKCALDQLDIDAVTLLLYGDVPLISKEILEELLSKYNNNIVVLTAKLDDPYGYGRIVRDDTGHVKQIVEEKDATSIERNIDEINSGIYAIPNSKLAKWLNNLSNNNGQGEYYVTDIVAMAYQDGVHVDTVTTKNIDEIMGVNNKLQLEYLERKLQVQKAQELLVAGATLIDKSRIDIRGQVRVGQDCTIDINCIFEGNVTLGNNVRVGAGSILKNVTIKDNVNIKPYSILEDAVIGNDCQIGPFARIRPETELLDGAHIGNFVEVKKSQIGVGTKVNHLTYIGDSIVGAKTNIGAGSVTCNYDGKYKHQTQIGDNVFIGSGTMMVAPVKIGNGALIGAGSVITKDAPDNELTVSRAKQITVLGWLKSRFK